MCYIINHLQQKDETMIEFAEEEIKIINCLISNRLENIKSASPLDSDYNEKLTELSTLSAIHKQTESIARFEHVR